MTEAIVFSPFFFSNLDLFYGLTQVWLKYEYYFPVMNMMA